MTNADKYHIAPSHVAEEQGAEATNTHADKRPILSERGLRTIFADMNQVDADIQQLLEEADSPVFKQG